MAKSLTKSSASLVAAGGNLAEAAALTATANAIIQDADSVGTALKTTSLRLRGTSVKVLEEEGLDTDGAVESTSKLRSQVLATSGVDILTDTGAYKSTYQILLEIAEVWDKITDDKARAGLLELLAGKRNSSVIAALLQNPEQLKAAYEDAQNAEGSALKENEKYLDSIQGKIDQFNNAVQTLWSNTLDSDVVKFLVDLATKLIKIVDSIGPLNIAIVGLVAFLEKKHSVFSNFFNPAGSGAEELVRQVDESFDVEKAKNSIRGKKGARTKRINQLQAEGKTFDEIQADPKVQQYTRDVEEAEQALDEYNTTVQQTNATVQQASATTQANTAANQANAASNTASASAESADAAATSASSAAEVADTTVTETHTAATWKDIWAEMTRTGATGASVAATIKQVIATKLAKSALVQKGLAIMGVTAAEGASIPVTTMLAGGFVGLATSIWSAITAMWTFMTTTPIGWILLAVGAVVALGAAFSAIHKSTEELQEELDGFKSELSDIRSELDSVNSELETTNERIAELLAKDNLTFAEQEELERLQGISDELERQKELLETEEEYKSGLVGRQAAKVVDSKRNEIGAWLNGKSEDEEVLDDIDDYREIKNKFDKATSLKEREKYQKELDAKSEEIDEYISVISEALDGVEYGDSEESDAALDYLAELQDNYAIARGSASAKTNAIKGTLRKPEFESMSKALDYYKEALADGDASAEESIKEIINNNEDFVADLKARGVQAQDAIKYFTELGTNARFDTLEGKTEEIKRATEKLPEAFNNISRFMDGDTVDKTAIAEEFKGTSDKTREEIAKLVQDINDGKIDVDNALKKFELFGVQSVVEIEISEVQTNFKDAFTDLENADGLINTFQELADAIGSTSKAMDALNAAQAEMDYSGRVSIETALKLMESTDDYSKVLTISEGKLVLAEGAEENLIDARLEGMKASALKALEEAKVARETTILARSTAETALTTYNSAIETEIAAAVTATAWDKVLAAAAGLWAGIKSLFTSESWTEAYDRAYQDTLNSLGGDRAAEVKAKYATAEEQARKAQLEKDIENADKAIAEQDKEIEKLQGNYDLISGLNKDNIGDVFKSDDLEDPDAAKEKKLDEKMEAFQREMDYWENRIGANQAKYEQLQNEIDLLEKKGQKADASYYKQQIQFENERKWLLEQQKAAALSHLAVLEEGSEEWWEVANVLNGIEGELDDVTASIVDLQDAIGEIETYKFEEFNNRLDNLTSKLETIRNLIAPNGEEDWFDDEGNWTDAGIAYLGSYVQDLEFFKQGYQNTMDELAKYQSPYAGNESYYETLGIHSEQEYYDKVEELTDNQYQFAESISDTKQSIVDMYESSIDAVEEYVDTLIDGYNDYIDSVKEALDAERALYDFKKNVQKQAKDIAEIERRIASLSGSTNKSDIAERRKLEAQLYESRESLNDTYYDHAKNAQSEALDAEATAYEETMTKMVEGMRTSLQEATVDMGSFLDSVTIAVSMNADTVLAKYRETEVPLNDAITNPWEEAATKVGQYGGDANNLMDVWKKDGYFAEFKSTATTNLSSPWSAGSNAVTSFRQSVSDEMSNVVSDINSNVQKAKGLLSDLTANIQSTNIKLNGTQGLSYGSPDIENRSPSPSPVIAPIVEKKQQVDDRILKKYKLTASQVLALGYGPISLEKFEQLLRDYQIKYSSKYKQVANTQALERSLKKVLSGEYVTGPWAVRQYAKGTTGTTRDEWAITDEPKFGDELVLVPGKDGNLSFVRKGTGIVPADMTQKLFELAQIPTSDLMNKSLTAIVPNITKNDFKNEFNFESLVHVDTVDSDTLPKLEKMVDKKIDDFSKALNYSLKRFAR